MHKGFVMCAKPAKAGSARRTIRTERARREGKGFLTSAGAGAGSRLFDSRRVGSTRTCGLDDFEPRSNERAGGCGFDGHCLVYQQSDPRMLGRHGHLVHMGSEQRCDWVHSARRNLHRGVEVHTPGQSSWFLHSDCHCDPNANNCPGSLYDRQPAIAHPNADSYASSNHSTAYYPTAHDATTHDSATDHTPSDDASTHHATANHSSTNDASANDTSPHPPAKPGPDPRPARSPKPNPDGRMRGRSRIGRLPFTEPNALQGDRSGGVGERAWGSGRRAGGRSHVARRPANHRTLPDFELLGQEARARQVGVPDGSGGSARRRHLLRPSSRKNRYVRDACRDGFGPAYSHLLGGERNRC